MDQVIQILCSLCFELILHCHVSFRITPLLALTPCLKHFGRPNRPSHLRKPTRVIRTAFAFFPFFVRWGSWTTSIAFGILCEGLLASFRFMILRGSSLTPLNVGFQWELASTPFYLVVVLIVVVDDLRRCSNFLGESISC